MRRRETKEPSPLGRHHVTPMKSALRKGPKETVKVPKHDLVVDARIRVNYTKKKNKVCKQVVNCLGGDLDFIRETLLEGKLEVAFISKEGREPKKPPTRTTSDFPSTAYVLTKDYICLCLQPVRFQRWAEHLEDS